VDVKVTQQLVLAFTMAVLTVTTVSFAVAQQPPPPAPGQQQMELKAEGELVSVDTDARKLTIKTSTGAELEFSYDASTTVVGAQEGAAGLATRTGSQVVIDYEQDGRDKRATRIEVKPAAQ
jgi:Cu/Ag efflux protein CusF